MYRRLVTVLQAESAIVVPLVAHGRSLGELMLGSHKTEFFNSYDLDAIATVGAQLASAVEDATRSTQTDEALRRNIEQLTSVVRVSRELNSIMDLNSLVDVVHDEVMRTTHADCGAVLLFDRQGPSHSPVVTLARGCPLPETFSALDQKVIAAGEGQLVANYSTDGQSPAHEGVSSAIVVPIIDRNVTAGLIHVHSDAAGLLRPVFL